MMTGPDGQTFTIEQLTARHTITWHPDGTKTIYRDCVVVRADGVRRLYGIPVDQLDGAQ
jgi:hypothetical protein